MRKLDIGVVGAGTAGPAAALFLAEQDHRVTLYERVADPGPVGAGIMLQPSGQAVLGRLGLREWVLGRGDRIDRLRVVREGGGRLLELAYEDVWPGSFGVGLHRGVLFQALLSAVRRAPVELCLGVGADELEQAPGRRVSIVDQHGDRHRPHDLVVVADGARSRLRARTGVVRRVEPYPWGALWFMARDPEHAFRGELYQVVAGTRELFGLLPTGLDATGDTPQVSFFWSLRADAQAAFGDTFEAWRDRVRALEPRAGPILDQIQRPEQLLFSSYHDVVMSPWHAGPVVCIGDAAHAMSPQLGQGANLALVDAMVLASAIADERGDVVRALSEYSRRRHDHLAYYQVVTRWLTPFFQSDYDVLGTLRDALMPVMNRVPLFNRAMVLGMCGVADGHPWKRLEL